MKQGISGLRRVAALGALSAGSSLAIAVGWSEWQDRAFERFRAKVAHEKAEATRSWRPTADHFDPAKRLERQPVVRDFRVVDVEEANKYVNDAELVLGVEVNGEHRAYPINIMTGPNREIFNDELGGRSIAATW